MLFSQGFGSRRECRALIARGAVSLAGYPTDDPATTVPDGAIDFTVDGVAWRYREKVYLAMHKPPGFECSHDPQHHRSVFELLPWPLRQRGVQCVGRLDQDTTGLLLFSDDGAFVHQLTAPKRKVPKCYRATLKHAVNDALLDALGAGVVLRDAPEPMAALAVHRVGDAEIELEIAEGKYHQVKRMVAAAGNRVVGLHRVAIGGLTLPSDLLEGTWRYLDDAERAALRAKNAPTVGYVNA
ncbi:ribosomal small subunit pseudouridine synthase A [Chitinasiproducens palmae]|uniref:Pseudouridine synthase n=2 Tax=Chitinasiproducens palmae TaxID=1770053 RepID=A0A1H2PR69_9BURK|nr:ribosomal small subunit pseudouridine synthase A [Chitinasiproducens palmae]